MSTPKEIDEIFEKPDNKEYVNDDITLTDTKESLSKPKRQPRKQKLNIDFEKEKNDFLSSLLSKKEDEPEKKKEVKEVKTVENKERKLQLIENLKKAREQKKLNKQQPKEQPKEQPKQEESKEIVKEQIKEDPEYLEWKKQRNAKHQELPKQEVKVEPIKIQQIKVEPQIVQQPKPEYIQRCTFKKPKWG